MESTVNQWRSLYPETEPRYWTVGGHRYHYLDQGSGPVVLCVHGNPTWSFYYRAVAQQFANTHRVIAVDHIGCGFSDKPPRNKFNYCLTSHRDNLIGLMDHLQLSDVTLLAHDWGGAIGLSAAIERIDRFSGIILLNTAAFPPPYVPWRIGVLRTPLLGSFAIRAWNAFAYPALTMAMSKNRLNPAVAQGLIAPYRNWHDRVAVDGFVRDIPLSERHPTYAVLKDLESKLVRLNHLPKKLIWGMQDWCFRPECLERFVSHWPDAEVVRLHDVGHYVLEDAPVETIAAIGDFLAKHGK